MKRFCVVLACLVTFVSTAPTKADVILSFTNADFGLTPVFNNMQTFNFDIRLSGDLHTGVWDNPEILSIDYRVFGVLPTSTPSGFPAFNLVRSMDGTEFYGQGSSLSFEVSGTADLSDGIQLSEMVGLDPVFTLNAREVGTGRYHPPLIELNADGTGRMQNSNNFGGINPGNGQFVDVDLGEEYITDLAFSPTNLTLLVAVPEPTGAGLVMLVIGMLAFRRRAK